MKNTLQFKRRYSQHVTESIVLKVTMQPLSTAPVIKCKHTELKASGEPLFFLPFHSKALPNAFYKGGGGGIVSLINNNK